MAKRIILVNGPPRSGKDTAANIIAEEFKAVHLKFSTPLKRGTHESLGMRNINPEAFDHCKDEPNDKFLRLTPRNAYIAHSTYMKTLYGENVWGKIMANIIIGLEKAYFLRLHVVISDCGFSSEIAEMLKIAPHKDVTIFRILRPGHDFKQDSRDYIHTVGGQNIMNAGDQVAFEREVCFQAHKFINRK